ncbi:MAG: hypothetical protein EOP82_14970, partial [Variovorax sp.]
VLPWCGRDESIVVAATACEHDQGRDGGVTGRYIADQPVRSVLVAAAAGAAITALIVLASRRRDDY